METNEEEKRISRRGFLKSAGVGIAAASSAGLLAGCGAQPSESAESGEIALEGEAPVEAASTEAGSSTPSFLKPPAPIPAEDISETVTADVVVIGAGVSGLMAALAAAEEGAQTILIEKSASFNARGGHNAALGSKLQKAEGIDYDKGRVVRELSRWSGNKADERLIMLWAQNCNETIDYLIDMADAQGMEVTTWGNDTPDAYWPEYKTVHMFGGMDENNVAGMVEQAFLENGGEVRYETPAVQLVREDGGPVTGVIAGTEGSYTQFNANKAVVLCTGDYGNNPEMVDYYCPKAKDITMNVYAPAVNTGDGQMMGMWIGAAMQEDEPHTPMIHNLGGPPMSSHPFLRVNKYGVRYENEDVPIPYLCNAIQNLPGNIAWTIFDSTYAEDVPNMGSGFSRSPVVSDMTVSGLESAVEAGTMAHSADTLDELAGKIGVPADALKATVERYNQLAEQGEDLDFGKSPEMVTLIDTPPYYAVTNPLALLVVLGGLQVNPKLQVLDKDGSVIDGLYAAGNASGGFFSNDYPVIVPGLSHSRALTFGRIAGKNAAATEL